MTREQAQEKSHHNHAIRKKRWNGTDSEVPDQMAGSVRNASDLDAKKMAEEEAEAERGAEWEENRAEERSAEAAVAHGHEHVRVRARVYYCSPVVDS